MKSLRIAGALIALAATGPAFATTNTTVTVNLDVPQVCTIAVANASVTVTPTFNETTGTYDDVTSAPEDLLWSWNGTRGAYITADTFNWGMPVGASVRLAISDDGRAECGTGTDAVFTGNGESATILTGIGVTALNCRASAQYSVEDINAVPPGIYPTDIRLTLLAQ